MEISAENSSSKHKICKYFPGTCHCQLQRNSSASKSRKGLNAVFFRGNNSNDLVIQTTEEEIFPHTFWWRTSRVEWKHKAVFEKTMEIFLVWLLCRTTKWELTAYICRLIHPANFSKISRTCYYCTDNSHSVFLVPPSAQLAYLTTKWNEIEMDLYFMLIGLH